MTGVQTIALASGTGASSGQAESMTSAENRLETDIDTDISVDDERAWAVSLAGTWLALGAARSGGRTFATYALCFATLLWGEFARGGFFRIDLVVFTALAVATLATVPRAVQIVLRTPWLMWSAGSIIAAILISAIKNGQLDRAGYALAPVIVAVALAVVGISVAGTPDRLLVKRLIVDVAVLAAVLGTVGVAFHLPRFAELQAEGWRASANIGYANAAGLVLLFGLLCACACAAVSGALTDQIRCWLIAVGLIATQSRGTIVALAICWVFFLIARRSMAAMLTRSIAWGLVTFVGLLPAVERTAPQPLMAALAAATALTLLVATSRDMSPRLTRVLGIALGAGSAGVIVVLLNTRVADPGSNEGRLRLWHEAVSQLHVTGVFGAGPQQIADFSNGHVTQLFAHNDALQYAEYYGIFGAIALLVLGWQVIALFARTAHRADRVDWSLGVATLLALTFAVLVDFPLQIPLIPAMAALVVGLTAHPRSFTEAPAVSPTGKATP